MRDFAASFQRSSIYGSVGAYKIVSQQTCLQLLEHFVRSTNHALLILFNVPYAATNSNYKIHKISVNDALAISES